MQSAGGEVVREAADGGFEACFDAPEAVAAAEFLQGQRPGLYSMDDVVGQL